MFESYKILTFADRSEWRDNLREIQADDFYFSPEYLKCNEIILGGEAECFVYQDNNTKIVYPYILRQIEGTEYYDITSGYGFGGFIGWPRRVGIGGFRRSFRKYCLERKIVSEFVRFHPFFDNHFYDDYNDSESRNVINYKMVVYCPFDYSGTSLEQYIKREVRKKIKKAMRNGIEIRRTLNDDNYQGLISIYYETMNRLRAASFYFFPREFFYELKRLLAESLMLFTAWWAGEMVGGLLVVYGQDYSYNFLSGSKAAYHRLGLNDLIQYKVLEWAGSAGKKAHMLGGGIKREDSLFRFKAKFSPSRLGYYLGKFIHLPEVYHQLCVQKARGVSSEQQFSSTESGWFPAYRDFLK